MSRQRKMHHKVACRQHTYKFVRKIVDRDFNYKHCPRWRKIAMDLGRKSLIQKDYNLFGPEDFGAKRKCFRGER